MISIIFDKSCSTSPCIALHRTSLELCILLYVNLRSSHRVDATLSLSLRPVLRSSLPVVLLLHLAAFLFHWRILYCCTVFGYFGRLPPGGTRYSYGKTIP